MRARRNGRPIAVADAQIAAIAASRQFSVATRADALFRAAVIPVINPWAQALEIRLVDPDSCAEANPGHT